MDDRRAFLEAIAENPEDNTPRLVYSDWLEEHGESDWAELIRLSIEAYSGREDPIVLSQTAVSRIIQLKTLVEPRFWQASPQTTGKHSAIVDYSPVWDRGFITNVMCPGWNNTKNYEHLFSRHPIHTLRFFSWQGVKYSLPDNAAEIMWSLKWIEFPVSAFRPEEQSEIDKIFPGVAKVTLGRGEDQEVFIAPGEEIRYGEEIGSDSQGYAVRWRPGMARLGFARTISRDNTRVILRR